MAKQQRSQPLTTNRHTRFTEAQLIAPAPLQLEQLAHALDGRGFVGLELVADEMTELGFQTVTLDTVAGVVAALLARDLVELYLTRGLEYGIQLPTTPAFNLIRVTLR